MIAIARKIVRVRLGQPRYSGCAWQSVQASDPAPNLAESVLLTDAVTTHGARCLDGSPQRLWLQLASHPANASKWYFHFMGGAWCKSEEECIDRAYDPTKCYRGSSNVSCFNANGDKEPGVDFNQTMDFRDVPAINGARWGGGLLISDPTTNPLTHDWNKVEIVYCDGGSYSGNNETVGRVSFGGIDNRPLYYRGQRNLEAAIDYLATEHGMDAASHLVVSGDSAGGLATYWHADWFQTRLPKTKVIVAPDSGFFLGDQSKPAWPTSLAWIATAMNSTRGLDASCVSAAAAAHKSAATACTLPEDVAKHIEVPVFVMNSRFDPALISISTSKVDPNVVGLKVLDTVNRTVLAGRPNNAAFITSCHEHCGQWAQGQILEGHNDFNVTIDGWTAPFALDSWAAGVWAGQAPARTVWVQKHLYPCDDCCLGGN
eukprot:m.217978 g.217978  ORF g.217978 m.217978 type:complete len:430 (-) comp15566_c0_seq1:2100-3389(-)